MGGKGIAVGTEGAGNIQYRRISQGLLHPVADGIIVVLGLHDGNGDARFPGENIVGEFFLFPVPGGHVAPHDNGAGGERHLAPDL